MSSRSLGSFNFVENVWSIQARYISGPWNAIRLSFLSNVWVSTTCLELLLQTVFRKPLSINFLILRLFYETFLDNVAYLNLIFDYYQEQSCQLYNQMSTYSSRLTTRHRVCRSQLPCCFPRLSDLSRVLPLRGAIGTPGLQSCFVSAARDLLIWVLSFTVLISIATYWLDFLPHHHLCSTLRSGTRPNRIKLPFRHIPARSLSLPRSLRMLASSLLTIAANSHSQDSAVSSTLANTGCPLISSFVRVWLP